MKTNQNIKNEDLQVAQNQTDASSSTITIVYLEFKRQKHIVTLSHKIKKFKIWDIWEKIKYQCVHYRENVGLKRTQDLSGVLTSFKQRCWTVQKKKHSHYPIYSKHIDFSFLHDCVNKIKILQTRVYKINLSFKICTEDHAVADIKIVFCGSCIS